MIDSVEDSDQGSVSVFTLVIAIGLTFIVAVGFDALRLSYEVQEAHDVARLAARTAAQEIDESAGMQGMAPSIDSSKIASVAHRVLAAHSANGQVSVTGGVITVQSKTTVAGLGLLGSQTVSSRAEVRLVRTQNGVER